MCRRVLEYLIKHAGLVLECEHTDAEINGSSPGRETDSLLYKG